MAIERHMFINNYTSTIISIQITAYENVGVFEMQTEGDVEQQVDTQSIGGGSSVTWTMRVPAGGIYGLGVYNGLTYTNPDPNHLTIVGGSDKDPWPPPPPPPPLFVNVTDYEDRYADFLIALSGQR